MAAAVAAVDFFVDRNVLVKARTGTRRARAGTRATPPARLIQRSPKNSKPVLRTQFFGCNVPAVAGCPGAPRSGDCTGAVVDGSGGWNVCYLGDVVEGSSGKSVSERV